MLTVGHTRTVYAIRPYTPSFSSVYANGGELKPRLNQQTSQTDPALRAVYATRPAHTRNRADKTYAVG